MIAHCVSCTFCTLPGGLWSVVFPLWPRSKEAFFGEAVSNQRSVVGLQLSMKGQ